MSPLTKTVRGIAVATALALTLCGEHSFAQQAKNDGAIVYGGRIGITIAAPAGWVIDSASGKQAGVPAVLYPKGQSWSSADTVMYVNFTKRKAPGAQGVTAVITRDLQATKKVAGKSTATAAGSGKTHSGIAYTLYDFSGVGKNAARERVAYLNTPDNITLLVLSAKTKTGFDAMLPAYKKWLDGATYLAVTNSTKK